MLAVLCALGAALMYAAASVLQQRSAAAQSSEHSLRLGLLVRLVRRPLWLTGVVADVLGYVLQFVALGHGTLVVVQPLLVCGLLFALPLGAWLSGARLHRRDWGSATVVCVGLAVFLVVANPAKGHDNVRLHVWVPLLLSGVAVTGGLVVGAVRAASPRTKAVLLSAAAGVTYGVAAALTKTCSHLLGRGIGVTVTYWQPYVLVVAGVGGMLLAQSAFQAGSLDASLPTMTVTDPVVSILIGAVAFGETVRLDAVRGTADVLALVVMSVGVFALARTPAIRMLHADGDQEPEPVTPS